MSTSKTHSTRPWWPDLKSSAQPEPPLYPTASSSTSSVVDTEKPIEESLSTTTLSSVSTTPHLKFAPKESLKLDRFNLVVYDGFEEIEFPILEADLPFIKSEVLNMFNFYKAVKCWIEKNEVILQTWLKIPPRR
jgi:hypothetical protein